MPKNTEVIPMTELLAYLDILEHSHSGLLEE